MPFTIQDSSSGLFWTTGLFGRVQLGITPNSYVVEGSYIKNVETGSYVNHRVDLLHEGGDAEEFEFQADGTITSQGKAVIAAQFVHIREGEPTKWVRVEEVDDDVPVSRASALIEEALNAPKVCACETCTCDPCECVEEPAPEAAPVDEAH